MQPTADPSLQGLRFHWLDVFTPRPLAGNALCVVFDGDLLAPEDMQATARETNLSETTFVLRPTHPDATYRVRIFTPGTELPFAGHPTLGTAAALVFAGRVPAGDLVQESAAGLTSLHVERPGEDVLKATMHAPLPRLVGQVEPQRVAAALRIAAVALKPGLGPELIEAGIRHLLVPLGSVDTLTQLQPDTSLVAQVSRETGATGIYPFALHPSGVPALARARLFAPLHGVSEDPASGSAAAPLGFYLHRHGLLPGSGAFSYEQGIEMGRPSLLHVQVIPDSGTGIVIKVSGDVCLVAEGQFRVPSGR